MVINTPFRELSCLLSIHHQSRVKKKSWAAREGGRGDWEKVSYCIAAIYVLHWQTICSGHDTKEHGYRSKNNLLLSGYWSQALVPIPPPDNPVAITIIPSGKTTKERLGRGERRIDEVVKEEAENCGLKGGQMGRVNSHPGCKTQHWSGETTYNKKRKTYSRHCSWLMATSHPSLYSCATEIKGPPPHTER